MGNEVDNAFKGNYHGVLDHNGCIKVAGYDTTSTIIYINKYKRKFRDVLVTGRKKSYPCPIHKTLKQYMIYCDVGDTALLKRHNGRMWLVGFKKSKANMIPDEEDEVVVEGDSLICWNTFKNKKSYTNVRADGVKSI